MTDGYQALTEKEKQTLRLIVRGHDAKSAARELGLSVHTVNERLREARRKLAVSSSREAARRLFESEGTDPESLMDKHLGDAAAPSGMRPDGHRAKMHRLAWIIGGVLIMSLIVAALALGALPPVASPPARTAQATQAAPAAPVDAATAAEATRTARAWLALVDQGRWEESWNASGRQFRQANTSKTWAAISAAVRPPLGTVASRTLLSQEKVPAPPHGYLIVKFRTSFANKPEAVETVSLEREGQEWKVVGYWIA